MCVCVKIEKITFQITFFPLPLFFKVQNDLKIEVNTAFNYKYIFAFLLQSNKVPVVQHPHHMHPLTPLITYSNDHFSPSSPPSHLSPEIDPKTGECLKITVLSKAYRSVWVPCQEKSTINKLRGKESKQKCKFISRYL